MQKSLYFTGRFGVVMLGLLWSAVSGDSQTVSLTWNATTNASVAGYALYYGSASHQYSTKFDVGTNRMATVSGLAPGVTNYFAVVDYTGAGMQSAFSSEIAYALPITNSITPTNLPAPWQSANIGAAHLAGAATATGGVFTVTGAGNLSGTADSFQFLFQTLSGNGEIRACLNSMQNTGVNGRIGLMIRETPTAGSRYAFVGMSPDDAYRWQRRNNTGGSTTSTKSGTGVPPNTWLRLVRTGNNLYGYSSTNGVNWNLISSHSVTMATNIYAGLVVAAGTTNTLNTAVFSNVTVVP